MKKRSIEALLGLLCIMLCAGLVSQSKAAARTSEPTFPCEIVIENLTRGENMPDLKDVEDAVNAITIPAINCSVKIENVHIADHARRMELNKALESRLDIVNVGRTMPFPQMVTDGLLYPLDELLELYGSILQEKASKLLPSCMINNHIYCLPSNLYMSKQAGFLYNETLAASCGLVLDEVMTLEAIEQAAEILSSRGIYLLTQGTGLNTLDLFGTLYPEVTAADSGSYINGVFQDEDWTKIVNVFETETYLNYCHTLRRWKENGWMPAEALVNGISAQKMFERGQVFMNWIDVSPIALALQRKNYSFEVGMFVTAPDNVLTMDRIHYSGWGISAGCEHPDKAMQLLNLITATQRLPIF